MGSSLLTCTGGDLVSSSVKWVPIVLSLPPWVLVRGQSHGGTFCEKMRYKWRPVVSVNHLLPPGASLGGRVGEGKEGFRSLGVFFFNRIYFLIFSLQFAFSIILH